MYNIGTEFEFVLLKGMGLDQGGEGEHSLPRVLDLPAGVRVTSVAMKVSSGYHRNT